MGQSSGLEFPFGSLNRREKIVSVPGAVAMGSSGSIVISTYGASNPVVQSSFLIRSLPLAVLTPSLTVGFLIFGAKTSIRTLLI